MTTSARFLASLVLAGVWTTAFALAQAPTPPTPAPQAPAAAAPAGRGGRATRPVASQDVLIRGKGLYDTNCANCHTPTLRGTPDGKYPSLLRSFVALRDQQGQLIGPQLAKHTPPITMGQADTVAVAEYIRSVQVNPAQVTKPVTLNVLVGNREAGRATFQAGCGQCHGADAMKAFAAKFDDPRALQDAWVSGTSSTFGRGGGGGLPATVTLADGSKLQGTLVREDNFIVTLILPDGTRRTMTRSNGVPRVEVNDIKAPHVDAIVRLAQEDGQSTMMHDITAYLWSLR
jgi:cytochrome c oxidase cbb3-type subunit 3